MAELGPRDAKNAAQAAINQIPETMEATRIVLRLVGNLDPVCQSGKPNDQFLQILSRLFVRVLDVENRIEASEGRSGVEPEQLIALLQEFGAGER